MTRTTLAALAALAACALLLSLAGSFSGCGSDSETDAGADAATCNNDRYASSCLTALSSGCFKAEGKCTWKDLSEIDWENGAKITNAFTPGSAATIVDSTFWSASGEKCYTTQASFASGQTSYDYSLTTTDGKTYTYHTDIDAKTGKATSTTVTCPDGKTESYMQADFDTIKACYQSVSAGSQTQACKCADGTTACYKCPDGTLDCVSTSSTICNLDTDCIGKPEGEFCCDVSGTKICQAAACAAQ